MKITDVVNVFRLPRARIDLMVDKTVGNDPFYNRLTRNFHKEATARHSKLILFKRYEYGYALCVLPETFDMYFQRLEPSAHRNHRKALRLGCTVRPFDFNAHLEDVREILRSTPVRQGRLPWQIREGVVHPISNPPSRSPAHDYVYFGVFKDGKLLAYASCLIAGELCNIGDIFGHAKHQSDGVVPLLLIEIARHLIETRPLVKCYAYDTYFGAGDSLRRFKRKFLFHPYHVSWALGDEPRDAAPAGKMLVYRMDLPEPPPVTPAIDGRFVIVSRLSGILYNLSSWVKAWGWVESLKAAMRVLVGGQIFFGVLRNNAIVQSGWASVGFCRYYPVEKDAVVLGTLWTDPAARGQGLAPGAMRRVMGYLFHKGFRRFYIDVDVSNAPSRRMIEKTGFLQRIA